VAAFDLSQIYNVFIFLTTSMGHGSLICFLGVYTSYCVLAITFNIFRVVSNTPSFT
jgi:hypothetical protein